MTSNQNEGVYVCNIHILNAFCLDAVAFVLLGIIYHLLQGNDSTWICGEQWSSQQSCLCLINSVCLLEFN